MKARFVFAALFALVLTAILSGCGSSPQTVNPTASSPTAASAATSSGATSSSTDDPAASAKAYFDALYSGNPVTAFMCSVPAASISTLTHYADSVTAVLSASHATFDVTGLTYATANQTGDSADVSVGGKVTTVSAAGTSSTSNFPSLTLTMKNEGGWKICGLTT